MTKPRAQTGRVGCGEDEPSVFPENTIELAQRSQLIGQMLHAFLKQHVVGVTIGNREFGFQISKTTGQSIDFEKFRVEIVRLDRGTEIAQKTTHFSGTSGKIDDDLAFEIFKRMEKVLNVRCDSAASE